MVAFWAFISGLEPVPLSLTFGIFFGLFSLCFVTQALEFNAAGLSPEGLLVLVGWLGHGVVDEGIEASGSEELNFLQFHIRKTAGTMVVFSLIPLFYLIGNYYFVQIAGNVHGTAAISARLHSFIMTPSVLVPIGVITLVYYWKSGKWANHPIARRLSVYCSQNSWVDVMRDINAEFRRVDKLIVNTNTVTKVVVTDNWIMKVGPWPWQFYVAHQSDVKVEIVNSDHHNITIDGQVGGAQFLSISVVNRRPGVLPFSFRYYRFEC